MRTVTLFILGLLAAANILVYCVKPPDYPDEPVIEFISVTPNFILQRPFFRSPDTVYTDLTFSYTDGDGDLGFDDTTVSLVIYDLRTPNLSKDYRLPMVDPNGAGNGISGEITVRVPVSCCIPDPVDGILLPPCDTNSISNQLLDTLIYSIQIKDRSGNWSNLIQSDPIILRCRRQ
jgi:hypothetical protein